jgi:transposase
MASLRQGSCWVGIDVAKDRLDVHLRPSEQRFAVSTDPAGLAELVRRAQAARAEGIVLEASGGLERPVTHALAAAGLPCSVVNPRRVRAFATGLGWLAKTDRIDARALARYGELARPQPSPPAGPQQARLAALSARRRQLLGLKGQEANRLARVAEPLLRQQIEATLALLDSQLAEIDAALTQALARDPELAQRVALIQSMPGAGPRLAQALIAGLPELGRLKSPASAESRASI